MAEKQNTVSADREKIFSEMPVGKALYAMAAPTIVSQLINLVYNMVDTFFIGRTGNSYMVAATTITLTLVMLNVAVANLFGLGGGSHMARLMGRGKPEEARRVCSFAVYGITAVAAAYAVLAGVFMTPLLRLLGASDATIGYARSYGLIVIVIGAVPSMLSLALAHLLRNVGCSREASLGLSGGGVLNIALDPLFMFVLLPRGMEVTGAAIATTLSNVIACAYLLLVFRRASRTAPLSLRPADAAAIRPEDRKSLFTVGIPSALLPGLFDVANICANKLAAGHSDLVLAGLGIVMKVERIPNAFNVGLSQGMMPIVAYNYASGDHERMRRTIRVTRRVGLLAAAVSILLFEIFAEPVVRVFLSTTAGDAATALATVGFAALFLRIRALASPVQFLNYSSSFTLQAVGSGGATLLHACERILIVYIPLMFLLDRFFGERGLASALPAAEAISAVFVLTLLHYVFRRKGINAKNNEY